MESAFDTLKSSASRSLGKAAQLVLSEHDQLDMVEVLKQYSKLSIRVDNVQHIVDACLAYAVTGSTQFMPIHFSVRDETQQKKTVLRLKLVAGVGFVLQNTNDDEDEILMKVVLPEHSDNVQAKIQRSCGTSVYKVSKADSLGTIRVLHCGTNENQLKLSASQLWYLVLPKVIGVAFDKTKYRATDPSGNTRGFIWPKFRTLSRDAILVKFMSGCSEQDKAILLGVSCMHLLYCAHNELYNLLRMSMQTE